MFLYLSTELSTFQYRAIIYPVTIGSLSTVPPKMIPNLVWVEKKVKEGRTQKKTRKNRKRKLRAVDGGYTNSLVTH